MMEVESETAFAAYRTLMHSEVSSIFPIYLTQRTLQFSTPNRTLAAIHVERGQRVREGDVLAELVPLNVEDAERLFLRRQNAQIELDRFNRDYVIERDRRLAELERAREALDFADDYEWPRLALDLSRREATYRQFLVNNEQNRERLVTRLEDIDEQIAGDQIIAPFDGVITFVANERPGNELDGTPRIVVLAQEDSLLFMQSFSSLNQLMVWHGNAMYFRHDDILKMTMVIMPDIRLEFDARVVNDPWVRHNRTSGRFLFAPVDWDAFYEAIERYGADLAVTPAPLFAIEAVFESHVLSVPTSAIQGSHVYVYEQGYMRRQNVTTGIRCTVGREHRYIEILSGLLEGQEVLLR
jgi:hypothetical protein